MSTEFKFDGTFYYDDEDALAEAIDEAGAIMDEDPELAEILEDQSCFDVTDRYVSVDIDMSGPSEWYLILEGILETFAGAASSGRVRCWMDGEEMDAFVPGDD